MTALSFKNSIRPLNFHKLVVLRCFSTQPNLHDNDNLRSKIDDLKLVKHEYEIWKRVDSRIALELHATNWEKLLSLKYPLERLRYLTNLGDVSQQRESSIVAKRLRFQAFLDENIPKRDSRFYGLGGNFIFQRLERQILNEWANKHYAACYPTANLTIVYDMSVTEECSTRDQLVTCFNLQRAIKINCMHRQPAKVMLTSFSKKAQWFKQHESMVFLPEGIDNLAVALRQEHVSELFPNDRLVYLSPDSTVMLPHVDEDKVYIIGAMDDRTRQVVSHCRGEAKKRNIPCFKLPIDRYLNWSSGSKALVTHMVHSVLLDYMLAHDWSTALRNNIPRFFYKSHDQDAAAALDDAALAASLEAKVKQSEIKMYNQQREMYLLGLVSSEPF